MINNLNFIYPEIFISLSIMFLLLLGVFKKESSGLIYNLSIVFLIFTLTQQGIEGSIIQMISHGLVSAALFLCVGVLYDRTHSRLISSYGGIVSIMPKYAVVFMIFTLASIGLPGTSGFIGEFLILLGAFQKSIITAAIASLGVIFAAAYMLWLYKRVVFGNLINKELFKIPDLNKSEIFILWSLAIPTLFFGFYPAPLINTIEISIQDLIQMYDLNLSSYAEFNGDDLIK